MGLLEPIQFVGLDGLALQGREPIIIQGNDARMPALHGLAHIAGGAMLLDQLQQGAAAMDLLETIEQGRADVIAAGCGVEKQVGRVVQHQVRHDGQLALVVIGFQFAGGLEDGAVVEIEATRLEHLEQVQVTVLHDLELVGLHDAGIDPTGAGADGKAAQVIERADRLGLLQALAMRQQHAIATATQIDGEGDRLQRARHAAAGRGRHQVAVLAGLDQLYVALVRGGHVGDLAALDHEGLATGAHGQFQNGHAIVDEGIVVIEIGELDLDDGAVAGGGLCAGGAGAEQTHGQDEQDCEHASGARLVFIHGGGELELLVDVRQAGEESQGFGCRGEGFCGALAQVLANGQQTRVGASLRREDARFSGVGRRGWRCRAEGDQGRSGNNYLAACTAQYRQGVCA